MARRRHHMKRHHAKRHHVKRKANRWNKRFGKAARAAKNACSVEFIEKAKEGKAHSIQPYFDCIGREMKKALK